MEGSAFGKQENMAVDADKKQEAVVFSEEKLYASDVFRMLCYKVLPCCKLYNHNWKTCPFLHEGEKAGRRDPQKYRYVGIECLDAKKGECPRGETCPYAHNLFEFWLHPSRYRTQLCNKPSACRRKVCFFAHDVKDLRQPFMGLKTVTRGPCYSSPNDSDSANSEGYAVEDTSLESDSAIGQRQVQTSAFQAVDGSMISPCVFEPLADCLYVSTAPIFCDRSASAQRPVAVSSLRDKVESKIQNSHSTLSPQRDTMESHRMSPMIGAFRQTLSCQQEAADPQSPYGILDGSMHMDTMDSLNGGHAWKSDSSGSDDI